MTASFTRDCRAALEMPLRFVVYLILTGVIIAIAAIGFSHLEPAFTASSMEKQLGAISVSLNTMQYGAARNLMEPDSQAGNIRTFKIIIPEDVAYLAFGADPDPDNDNNLSNTRAGMVTERGNNIFYMSRKSGKKRIPLDENIELREGVLKKNRWVLNTDGGREYGAVITGKGTYELTFEQVYDPISKRKYILIHHTDELNAAINPYNSTMPKE